MRVFDKQGDFTVTIAKHGAIVDVCRTNDHGAAHATEPHTSSRVNFSIAQSCKSPNGCKGVPIVNNHDLVVDVHLLCDNFAIERAPRSQRKEAHVVFNMRHPRTTSSKLFD